MKEIVIALIDPIRKVIKYKEILISIVISDIKSKYAGSILGYIWLFLFPVIFLMMYALVYIMVLKVRLNMLSSFDYVLIIFSGLIPFLSFSDAIGRGVHSVTANSNLIKNTLFPIELIPIQITLSSQIFQLIGFVGLIIILIFTGKVHLSVILLPIIWILQIMFIVGLIWILSSLNVFFRDIANLVPIFVLMLMMISPIAYTEDMIPGNLKIVLYFNPLYYIIIMYQKILIFGQFDLKLFSIYLIISFSYYFIGYYIFTRLKEVFVDYV